LHFDQRSARCFVWTRREGALAAVGHDLKLEVGRFQVDADAMAGTIDARFFADSLKVVCAVVGGRDDPRAPSRGDRGTIEEHIVRDVLDAKAFPLVTFASTALIRAGEGFHVEGRLTLHGQTRLIAFDASARGDSLTARVRLHQPDFGIRPFRAMLGTLRVQADVEVEVSVPLLDVDGLR
jgi:hypothetical protein